MARDRQRAKQRRARRAQQDGPELTQPVRDNVPDELEHASADVDRFEAGIVSGAGGEPAVPDALDATGGESAPESLSDEQFAELEDQLDDVEESYESGDEREIARAEHALEGDGPVPGTTPARVPAGGTPTKKGRGRLVGFLRASWAELQRVQWPDRRQVGQATAVVLGFVLVAGAYLGVADAIAKKLVDLII